MLKGTETKRHTHEISVAESGPATEDKENVFSSINQAHYRKSKERGPFNQNEMDSNALILSRSSKDDFSPFGHLISEPRVTQFSDASSRKNAMMMNHGA